MTHTIHHGDCLDVLRQMPDNSVDAVVTDPPYGLSNTSPDKVADAIVRWATGDREYIPEGRGFMGSSWDAFVPPPAVWDEIYRVLKPGGHLVAFAGSRTHDLMGISIRLSGMDVRDSISWIAGSGFPKSHNIGKSTGDPKWDGWGTALKPSVEPISLARKPLSEKTVAQNTLTWGTGGLNIAACRITPAEPSSAPASSHSGQPTSQGAGGSSPADSTSRTSHEHGASRTDHSLSTPQEASSDAPLGGRSDLQPSASEGETSYPLAQGSRSDYRSSPCSCGARAQSGEAGDLGAAPSRNGVRGSLCGCAETQRIPSHQSMPCNDYTTGNVEPARAQGTQPAGRWPANVVLDPVTAEALDQQSGTSKDGVATNRNRGERIASTVNYANHDGQDHGYGGQGGASRFFKVVEPDTAFREDLKSRAPRRSESNFDVATGRPLGPATLMEDHIVEPDPPFMYAAKAPKKERPSYEDADGRIVQHSTVKPLSICSWLVKLVTPPGGTVLDPFAGSGTTVEAAILEGFNVIGIEREAEYLPLIQQRIDRATDTLPMAS